MTAMEMATAAEYNIGAKWLLLNNEYQGMVRQWQDLFYQERIPTLTLNLTLTLTLTLTCTIQAHGHEDDQPKFRQTRRIYARHRIPLRQYRGDINPNPNPNPSCDNIEVILSLKSHDIPSPST